MPLLSSERSESTAFFGATPLTQGTHMGDDRQERIRNDSSRTLLAASLKVQAFMPADRPPSAGAKSDAILRIE
jgi:hypothetical protein